MPEEEFRRYKPDYTGMDVREYVFCRMEDHHGREESYSLDVITAENDNISGRPVVFFIHGGGFIKPNDKRQAYISVFARKLTEAGYAVVSPDYPQFEDQADLDAAGGEQAGYGKAAEAIHRAFGWILDHAETLGLDGGRISMIGGSAGGWAAFHAVDSYPEDHYEALISCWGVPEGRPEVKDFPPVLLIHGTADGLVPYERAERAVALLSDAGVPNRLITLSGSGHTPLDRMGEFVPEILGILG